MAKEKEQKKPCAEQETKEPETEQSGEVTPTEEEKLKAELAEANDRYLRLRAEYDNFRKRSQKEKEQAYGDSKASAISELLPVYDNFVRAVGDSSGDAEAFKKGMEMIFNQFGEALKKLGVEPFGEAGESFDPNIHNAVMHIEDESLPENSIAEVFSTGYKIGDRVIRPAVVKVAN